MFKIPSWGEDVPKTDIQFGKTTKKKKKNESVLDTDSIKKKFVNIPKKKSNLNNHSTPFNAESKDVGKAKKKKKRKPKPVVSGDNTQSPLFKPGQFVLNPNKRKLDINSKDDSQSSENKKKKSNGDIANNGNGPQLGSSKRINKLREKKEISHVGLKINSKKEKIKKMLESNRNSIDGSSNSNKLRQRMLEKLKAAQFRYLNEKLYTSSGSEAKQFFQSDPDAFHTYHQGYQQQVKKWPVNPLDLIVKRIMKMPKTHTIADLGCGEAALSKRIPHTVRSFDLVASGPGVEVCDMAHTPLLSESVDVAVYCLALMGMDLAQYLVEANRILKPGGVLLIAEVESRFDDVESFASAVQRLGFKLKNLDKSREVFFLMEFVKVTHAPAKKSKLPAITLKPCLYKRR